MLIYLIVDILRSKWGVRRPGEIPAGRSPVNTTGKIDLCVNEHHHGSLTKHAARREPLPVDGRRFYWTLKSCRRPEPANSRIGIKMQRIRRRYRNARQSDIAGTTPKQIRDRELGSTGVPQERQYATAAGRDAGPTHPDERPA